jgi:hypothetical protein
MDVRLLLTPPSLCLASICILFLISVVDLGFPIVLVLVVLGVPVVPALSLVSAVLVALLAAIIAAI